VLDTIEPSVGRAERAQLPPRCWPGTSHRQWQADAARVHGDGIATDATRWVLLMHQAAPHARIAGPELRNRQLWLRHVDLQRYSRQPGPQRGPGV